MIMMQSFPLPLSIIESCGYFSVAPFFAMLLCYTLFLSSIVLTTTGSICILPSNWLASRWLHNYQQLVDKRKYRHTLHSASSPSFNPRIYLQPPFQIICFGLCKQPTVMQYYIPLMRQWPNFFAIAWKQQFSNTSCIERYLWR